MTATTEPKRLTAGDTIAWTKALADYQASSGWTLHYRLINADGHLDITTTAAGADHAVAVAAATSATWPAGIYTYSAYVTKASERYTVGSGQIDIAANLAAVTVGSDTRSDAQVILDNLLAAYRAATATHSYVAAYEHAGRKMQFNSKTDWLLEINFWRREVTREQRARRAAAGEDLGTKTYLRF